MWQPFYTSKTYQTKKGVLLPSSTREHHYISQVEQRVHACNSPIENPKIYKISKKNFSLPTSKILVSSVSIADNLKANNLYTLAYIDGTQQQYNLELWFNRYEEAFENAVEQLALLAEGPHSFNQYYIAVWRLKLLNILRNPYIASLSTGQYLHHFLKMQLERRHVNILPIVKKILQRSHQDLQNITRKFHFSKQYYANWLAVLAASLSEGIDDISIFDQFCYLLLNTQSSSLKHSLFRFNHSDKLCCFSDGAQCLQSFSLLRIIGMNISPSMFLSLEIEDSYWHELSQSHLNYPSIKGCFTVIENDITQLEMFNLLSKRQCFRSIYGLSPNINHY